MRKAFKWAIVIYIGIQIALHFGYKNPKESDYIIDDNITIQDSMKPLKLTPIKPDTTPYRGNESEVDDEPKCNF
jgi:hypothetical protein